MTHCTGINQLPC